MTDIHPAPTPIAYNHASLHDPEYPVTTASLVLPPLTLPPFNPEEHLCFECPKTTHTLESLKFSENITPTPPSNVGITEPFPLFTSSAIKSFRHELFQPQVLKDCAWYPNPETCQLRGMAPKFAKFMFDAWTHLNTHAAVNTAAVIE